MKITNQRVWSWAVLAGGLLLVRPPNLATAADSNNSPGGLAGSSYAQHGPGPAYGGAYAAYSANASGLPGRFSATYSEYGAVPGYARFGVGSSYGSGPLRKSGTGRSGRNPGRQPGSTAGRKLRRHETPRGHKIKPGLPF